MEAYRVLVVPEMKAIAIWKIKLVTKLATVVSKLRLVVI